MPDFTERLGRVLHSVTVEELETLGLGSVEFPLLEQGLVDLCRPWEELDEAARAFYTGKARRLGAEFGDDGSVVLSRAAMSRFLVEAEGRRGS